MGEQPVVPLAPRQPFWGLVVAYWSWGRKRRRRRRSGMDRVVAGRKRRRRRRRKREGRVCHGIIPSHAPPPHPTPLTQKKGRNKSISRVRSICVIY